jgi:hypothetical protein
MTIPVSTTSARPGRMLRSTAAILLGFITVVVLSLATDQVLHVLRVYPPWGQPMYDPRLNLLALSYRIVYTVAGSYVAARLAPHSPMGHAWTLGVIGFVIGLAAAIATIPMHLGPSWYPIAIALTALPCAWLGGALRVRQIEQR